MDTHEHTRIGIIGIISIYPSTHLYVDTVAITQYTHNHLITLISIQMIIRERERDVCMEIEVITVDIYIYIYIYIYI